MRLTGNIRALALSSLLLTGCTGGSHLARPTSAATSTAPHPQAHGQQFPTIGDAVKKLLGSDPQIIAFGEYHRWVAASTPSTLAIFARSIMPILADRGYKHIIAEFIPFGEDVDAELASFNKTGELGPILSSWYDGHSDRPGIMEALSQAAKLGITLHGCHASDKEYLPNLSRLPSIINQHALMLASQLSSLGDKIVLYNGYEHNSLPPLQEEIGTSIGPRLEVMAGGKYVEADIFSGDKVGELSPSQRFDIFGPSGLGTSWMQFIPQTGVALFSRRIGGGNTLLLPNIL